MARRRHRNTTLPVIEVTYLSDNTTETVLLVCKSRTGKTIKIIREDGTAVRLYTNKIEFALV